MIGPGSPPLCAVQAVVSSLQRRGNHPGPLFPFENGLPCVATTTLQKGGGKQKGAEFSKVFLRFLSQIVAWSFFS